MSDIQERVLKIISEQTGKKIDEIDLKAKFIDDLGLDSLDLVELVMAFEEEFGQEIPDEDAEKLVTVEDTVNYIKNNSSK